MAATPSIRVIKTSHFKGGERLWSNRYHFNGGTPADDTHWTTFSDAIVNAEKAQYTNDMSIVRTLGYAAGSDVPVFSKVYTTQGTLTPSTGNYPQNLQTATLVRFTTAARTSKNHPIYLFNYFHGPWVDQANNSRDLLGANHKTAALAYAASWITGFSDGTNTYVRSGPNGDAALTRIVEEYVTHRDFPYTTSV